MGADNKKNYPSRTFRIPPELLKRMDAYHKRTGISKTFIVEAAITKYLDENEPGGVKNG